MKKYLFLALTALCLMGISACEQPDLDYYLNKFPKPADYTPQYPNVAVVGYSISVFSSTLTDVYHPTFGVQANRETFGSSWVTLQCTYETSSPAITVAPYTGGIDVLKTTAMTVTATESGTITVTYPAPVGEKTGTTVNVVYNEDTGAVALVPSNN